MVCHLFPQRWRMLNIQSRETIGPEDHVTCLKLRRRVNLSPAFGAIYKTRIFYKYVFFKHPCSLLRNFFVAATRSFMKFLRRGKTLFYQISSHQQHTPFSVNTGGKSNTMDGPRRHSYTMIMRRFTVSVKLPVSDHKKGHFNM